MILSKKVIRFHLFISCIVLGTLLTISSSDWLGVWIGIEINLFRITPLLLGRSTSNECESSIKYFLVQACGSILMMAGILLNGVYFGVSYTVGEYGWRWGYLLIILALIIKMGVAPIHFWVPSVIRGASWEICFILSTWQKIAPLVVILNTGGIHIKSLLVVLGCLRSVIGGLGGMLQREIRFLLGYSSINHAGWILCGLMFSGRSVMWYLLFYTIINIFLFYFLHILEINNYISLLKGASLFNIKDLMVLSIFLLTLAGIPPRIGFSIKWCIFLVVGFHSIYASLVLVLGSVLCIYYYRCLRFVWFVFSSSKSWQRVSQTIHSSVSIRRIFWVIFGLWGLFSFIRIGVMLQ